MQNGITTGLNGSDTVKPEQNRRCLTFCLELEMSQLQKKSELPATWAPKLFDASRRIPGACMGVCACVSVSALGHAFVCVGVCRLGNT